MEPTESLDALEFVARVLVQWAELIRRVYEVDPLICPRCGSEMRVIGFITQPALIDRILDHLRSRDKIPRPPPVSSQSLASPA